MLAHENCVQLKFQIQGNSSSVGADAYISYRNSCNYYLSAEQPKAVLFCSQTAWRWHSVWLSYFQSEQDSTDYFPQPVFCCCNVEACNTS
jgi:hypothetical protein